MKYQLDMCMSGWWTKHKQKYFNVTVYKTIAIGTDTSPSIHIKNNFHYQDSYIAIYTY